MNFYACLRGWWSETEKVIFHFISYMHGKMQWSITYVWEIIEVLICSLNLREKQRGKILKIQYLSTRMPRIYLILWVEYSVWKLKIDSVAKGASGKQISKMSLNRYIVVTPFFFLFPKCWSLVVVTGFGLDVRVGNSVDYRWDKPYDVPFCSLLRTESSRVIIQI